MESCEACRRDRYIGLCYRAPGVGKTLSAVHHSRVEKIVPFDRWSVDASDDLLIKTVLFTAEVINTSARIEADLRQARSLVCAVGRRRSTRDEHRSALDVLQSRDEAWNAEHREHREYRPGHPPPLKPTYWKKLKDDESRLLAVPDLTSLIIVDEADRLSMNSLEQLRSGLRQGRTWYGADRHAGNRKAPRALPAVLLEDRFVHEFRALRDADIQALLEERWAPVGIHFPDAPPNQEVISAVIRLTRGNFRLLVRLLTQMERVLAINKLQDLSLDVVETARENLVIGQA